jgi:hypothetical protein
MFTAFSEKTWTHFKFAKLVEFDENSKTTVNNLDNLNWISLVLRRSLFILFDIARSVHKIWHFGHTDTKVTILGISISYFNTSI